MMGISAEAGFVPESLTEEWLHARTVHRGECLVWTGQADNGGRDPRASIDGIKNINVRRVLWSMLHMRKPAHDCFIVAGCGTKCCVQPEHLLERTRGDGQRGRPKTLLHRAAIAETKRKSSHYDQSVVHEILASPLPGPAEGRLRGISKDMVNRIRAGQSRRDYNLGSPFAQLGAR